MDLNWFELNWTDFISILFKWIAFCIEGPKTMVERKSLTWNKMNIEKVELNWSKLDFVFAYLRPWWREKVWPEMMQIYNIDKVLKNILVYKR